MKRMAALALLSLNGCATPLPQVVPRHDSELFDVRYDPRAQGVDQVDAVANAHCQSGGAANVGHETRFDGFSYRTYRCARS
jgi:hypothetical protein